jgi:tetratricopeptide (TPR) repeat protein
MAQDRAKQLLQQGITAARAGQKDQARQILQQAVRLEPQNETIWLWLSSVAKDDKERVFCLKQLLAINPQHELALKGLQALGVEPQKQAEPTPAVPVIAPDKLNKILPTVDEFLRSYSPQPTTGCARRRGVTARPPLGGCARRPMPRLPPSPLS